MGGWVKLSTRCLCGAGLMVLLFLVFRPSSAHVPITTKVRFTREVIRIFQQNCLGCHRPGGIAPFSLASFEEARPWAKAIKEEILEKRMPPWNAVKGFGDFRNAPPLMQNDIDLIVNWVEGGVPKGELKDLPPEPVIAQEWRLGEPDQVYELMTVGVPADADEFRCLSVPVASDHDLWLSALDLDPGNGAVVHCATFYRERPQAEASTGASASDGNPRLPTEPCPPRGDILATWVPGLPQPMLPAGVGYRLSAGTRLIARIHYRGVGHETQARSRLGVYFADGDTVRRVEPLAFAEDAGPIPPGESRYVIRLHKIVQTDADVVGLVPLAHPLMVSLQVTAYRPDETATVLLWTRGSRFDWRPTYIYKQPISLPRGTRLEVVAYFDNSPGNPYLENESPRSVRLSNLTPDPLCTLLVAQRTDRMSSRGSSSATSRP